MRLALSLLAVAALGTGCATVNALTGAVQEPAALDPSRPIEVSTGAFENGYAQAGRRVPEKEVEQAVRTDPAAARLWSKGTTYQLMAALSWATGTVLMFWPLGQAMWAGHETHTWDWDAANWNLAAGGAVAWGIGFSLLAMSSGHRADAVDVYNDRFRRRAEAPRLTPLLGPAGRDGFLAGVRLDW